MFTLRRMNRDSKRPRGPTLPLLLLLLVSLAAPACTFLRRPPPLVDRSHDAQIRTEVEARLAAEPAIGTGMIRVEVDGGVVRLYGAVRGIGAWGCAIRTAGLAVHVLSVVDFLVLEPGPRTITCLAPATPPPPLAHIVPASGTHTRSGPGHGILWASTPVELLHDP